ncbi:hypothetical protein [uncultured Amnibacterium sp.]|uniref:hypothetical protein n=1 Tax=uncultured Amnibacterium sp. TaxID=1631851 RepID=UPI0035CA8FF9
MTVLVIGGTGILAPVVAALRVEGDVVAPSRRTEPPFDGHGDGASVPGAFDAAAVYAPAVSEATLRRLRAAVSGRLVLVQPSAASAPDADPAWARAAEAVGAVRVLLGWAGPDGGARWHTPEEIAPAVLAALADGAPRVVGRVRPWSDRPFLAL